MRSSEQINELAGALAKAQAKIEGAVKAAVNPHFRNQYADLGNVWAAIREPLTSNGLAVVQLLRSVQGGVECETILMHTCGQFIAETLFMPANKNDAQGYGSAATYARRYSLQAMVGIAPVDDDGEGARGKGDSHPDHTPPTKPGPKSIERGTPLRDARQEIDAGTASTVPQGKQAATPITPAAFATGDLGREFLQRAKADLATVMDGPRLAEWRKEFEWECSAIFDHAPAKRVEFLNEHLALAMDRCRAPVNLRAAG